MRCNYECKDDEAKLTREQNDKYHRGGKTLYYLYLGNDEHTKDKSCLLPLHR